MVFIALFIQISTNSSFAYSGSNDYSLTQDSLKYSSKHNEFKSNALLLDETRVYLKERKIEDFSNAELFVLILFLEDEIEVGNFCLVDSILSAFNELNNISTYQLACIQYLNGKKHYFKHNYSDAIIYFKKVLKYSSLSYETSLLKITNYLLGLSYYKLGDNGNAVKYFEESLNFSLENDYYYFDGFLKLSIAYYKLGKLDSAIQCLNEHNELLHRLDKTGKSNLLMAKIFQMRAFFYREKALNNPDSLNLLKNSLADCKQSVVLINRYVQNQNFESDQLIFNNRYNYFFYKTIEAADRVYKIELHDSLLYQAFYYAELDKNLALLRYLQKKRMQQDLGIANEDVDVLDSLDFALLKTEEEIYNHELEGDLADSILLNQYAKKRSIMNALTEKEQDLNERFPKYGAQKYRLPVLDVDFLTQLSEKKQIVEYVISDEKVYSFYINEGKIYKHHFTFDDSLFIKIEKFRQLTGDVKHINFSRKQYLNYCSLAYELYALLLKPYQEYFNDKPLLVIPDNELNAIPFEALLTHNNVSKTPDYSSLPYLLHRFSISYANSIELLKYQSQNDGSTALNASVLSYAPSYNKLRGNKSRQYLALRDARDELGDLPGAKAEVKGINKFMDSKAFLSSQASEESFKQQSNKFAVVHCAMHALVNNDNPMFSKLVFTPNVDKVEDGLLNTYEIGQANLNAEMVVLSACNTGYGKINKGEGLLSLSRGFIQAGCKSILSTLWSVSDMSGAKLMNDFYRGIAQALPKSESLTQSKRNYLQNNTGIEAHPYFWAGYVISGNDAPIQLKAPKSNMRYLIGIPVLLFVLLYFYRRKKMLDNKV